MTILFHASTNKDMDKIKPTRTLSKDRYIGNYIFATSDRILATMYLVTRGNATLMNSKAEPPYVVICADEAEYLKNDKGGAIYELPSETFTVTPQKELSEYELVSRQSVNPLTKITYEKSLDAMLGAGITVRFVDQQTFDSLIGNPRQTELIKNLPTLS
jgi:hypothetical protein